MNAQIDQNCSGNPSQENHGGRPAEFSPKEAKAKHGIKITVEGDFEKDFSRKMLAVLI